MGVIQVQHSMCMFACVNKQTVKNSRDKVQGCTYCFSDKINRTDNVFLTKDAKIKYQISKKAINFYFININLPHVLTC